MKIATWNVNSLRVRLPQVLAWLSRQAPDVLCMQETKLQDEDFPRAEFEAAGYAVAYSGQKTYNGVATASRLPAGDVQKDMTGFDDPQRRVLVLGCGDVRVINLYVPNGESVSSEKYDYKLRWLDRLATWLADEMKHNPRLVVVGDFNIAPADEDVHDPGLWRGQVLCSEPEREAFRRLLDIGFVDTFRRFEQPPKSFTWWDYRQAAFRRNMGLRIDHILAAPALADACRACVIDREPRRNERPSDHTPVIAEFDTS